ncbi:MAG: hypothetical protein IPK19_03105 [Chloroflexi bacterium]|nr:hypothetical protein [Chloroflexota bacterium]
MNENATADSANPSVSLPEALNFDEQDLELNRAGQISDAQAERIRSLWRRNLLWIVGGLLFNGLAATVLIFAGTSSNSTPLIFIGMGLTVLNAVIMGLGATNYMRTQRDLRQRQVETIQGTLRHTIRVSGRNRTYILEVGGERLIVPRPVFSAFEEAKAYRLYRSPATRILFAAERA